MSLPESPNASSEDQTLSSGSQPTKDDVLGALDVELATIETTSSKAGWNMWGLVAALASVCWLMLGEIGEDKFNLLSSFYYLICMLILADLGLLVFSGSNSSFNRSSEARFRPTRFIEHRRQFFYFSFLRALMLYGLGVYFGYSTSTAVPLFFHVYSLVMIVLWICAILLVLLDDINLQTNSSDVKESKGYVFNYLFLSIPIACIFEYTNLPWTPDSAIPSFKLALLLAASIEISRLIISHSKTPPLYQALYSIRRNLFFGKITCLEAVKQMEITLNGLRLSEIFQDDLQALLSALNAMSIKTKENRVALLETLKDSKRIEGDYIGQEMTGERIREFKARFSKFKEDPSVDRVLASSNETRQMFRAFKERYRKFAQKMKLTAACNNNVQSELYVLLSQLDDALSVTEKEIDDFLVVVNQCQRSMESLELFSETLDK
ncbi:MAG TPA: hypothetical protein VGH19_10375 [Verrucomicrobiae bacterium]